MKTDTSDAECTNSAVDISSSTIFDLLLARRRRYALYYLTNRVGAVSLEEVADQIALREADRSADNVERISTGLHHKHLPKLVDAQIARYDPVLETVELLDGAEKLTPYLELAAVDDR